MSDIDQDGLISRDDMYTLLDMITDEPLKESVKKKVVDEVSVSSCQRENQERCVCVCFQVLIEVNKKDADGLNTEDFHYAISRSPDFARYY